MTVVGIDLGTTNTVIAAVRDGRATALKDKHGNALLPSVVSFTAKGTPKVGHAAKARRTIDPENTVFSTKRLIGRTYDSEHVQKARTRLPFTLKGGPGKSTLVHCYGLDHTLPEISALVLGEAQAIAEARLGEPVTDAVITVPANFNDLQRAATKVAGRTAGLEVLRIINEPTAAALAYGFGKRGQERIAVYDFGGGTFDVTLLDLRDNVFEVLSTAGDTFLGGDDIDRAIMDQMAEELLRRHKIDASKDNLVREQLRVAAEKLKLELSTRSMAKTRVEELDFDFVMRRSEFEKLTEPFVARTLEVCQEAMEVAAISKKDLDQVLLVGGSTRIPLVRRRISSFFGKMPQSRINPDEVVAIGAAIQASALEAKQNKASIMPPPRPLAAARPSRPSAAGASATQMGLAGLRKTLSGTGRMSDRPPEQRQVSSVLSGLKSTPPGPNNPGMRASARPRTDKLTAEGERGGLSGLSPHPEQRRPLKDTSVGLGSASPPPRLSATSEADLPDFEDVTQVQKRPDQLAAERDRAADSSRFADARSKQGTLRGEPMFPAPQRPSSLPPSGDGSVTFDLEDLEGSENEFDSLKDETTQIVEPNRANAEAAQLDSIADADDTGVGLPSPTRNPKIEELGDSALFAFEEEDDEAAELPSPGAGLPVRAAPPVPSPAFGGVASGKADRAAHGPAPAPATGLPAPVRKESVGLPQNAAELPLRARYRPQSIEPDSFEEPPDLPLVGAGLPLLGASLPTVGGLPLPSSPDATQSQRREAQTERNPAAPPAVPAFARASFGTPGARTVLPAPSVDELDELSVSAPLPTDDAEEQTEFDLQAHQRFAAGGVLDEGLSRTSWEGAPGSVPPSHQSWGPATPPSGGAPLPTEHDQRRMPDEPLPSAPLLIDVTPLSLGVEVVGGYVDRLIERNSPVPCERTRTFATAQDNQQMVRVRVSQGEEGRFEANTVLGEIELTGIPPGPRGSVKVDVSFSLDESGMLQVSARDPVSGNAANARLMLAGVAP